MGEGAFFGLGPPGPLPHGRGGLLRLETTGAPAARARGLPSLWDHQGPRRMSEGASFALGPPRPPPREREGLPRLRGRRWSPAHTYWSLGAFPVGQAPGESVSWSAHGHLRHECCVEGGGGGQATDQATKTCPPNAATSVVPGGLRAHTRETASLFPCGAGGPCRKWSQRSASPPSAMPRGGGGGGSAACKAVVRARCAGQGTRGGDD